jgi:hypothetical protein
MTDFNYSWECLPVSKGNGFGDSAHEYLHFVVAVGPDGDRYAHFHAEMSVDPVCPPATDRILRRMAEAKPDPRFSDFWEETNPVAGSPADLLLQEDEALLARIEDERFGVLDYLSRPTRLA